MSIITIADTGQIIEADPDDNLLKVLRRHQVPIRYSCKRGECGSCKCRLENGEVAFLPHAPGALPAQQREQGLILACCARVGTSDLRLSLVDSDDFIAHPERHLVTTVTELREVVPDVFVLRLKIRFVDRGGEPFLFSAGQYAQLTVQTGPENWVSREFSIASTPVQAEYDDELAFHIRRTPGGAFSGLLGTVIQPGSTLYVEGPLGTSHFRPRHLGPLYAVAAGTGLAPMLSIVRTALHNGKIEDVVLWAGFRTAAEVYAVEELRELAAEFANFSFHVVVEQGATAEQRPGRVGDALLADVASFAEAKVYLAGSPAMVEAVSAALLARGLPPGDIHADAFYPPAAPVPALEPET